MLLLLLFSFLICLIHWFVSLSVYLHLYLSLNAHFPSIVVLFLFCIHSHLQNTEAFITHLQLQFLKSPNPQLIIGANILPIPSVIMLIVASRGFIFWCFNILSIPVILAYAKNILYGSKRSSDSDQRDFQYARSHTNGNDNILEVNDTADFSFSVSIIFN